MLDEPTCAGYYQAYSIAVKLVTASDAVTYWFSEDESYYEDCIVASDSNCLYHDSTNKLLLWTLGDETLVGENTVYIVPTFWYDDGYGSTLNYTYDDSSSTSFTLEV